MIKYYMLGAITAMAVIVSLEFIEAEVAKHYASIV